MLDDLKKERTKLWRNLKREALNHVPAQGARPY